MSDVQCYNKGCGQKFNPAENSEKSCTYHPGDPIFHDVYKSWSCCKKKTTDFTAFLNTKGCATGPHNPEKPKEPVKNQSDKINGDENKVISFQAPKPPQMAPRITEKEQPMKKLPVIIAQSLKQHLIKQTADDDKSETDEKKNTEISVGTQCKRAGCTKAYSTDLSPEDTCMFHSGSPIFHEGMKYWDCCQRKTSDFDSFLQQTGCTKGTHCWHKEDSQDAKKSSQPACRYDWHQTGADFYVTVYSKFPQPMDSQVRVNTVNLSAHIEYEDGKNIFDLQIPLWGAIDVANSMVTMSTAKVEIKMRKQANVSWPRLAYVNPTATTVNENCDSQA